MLTAALPGGFSFVASANSAARLVPRACFCATSAEFVRRFETLRGVEDARSLARAALAGKTLIFFPEGTFHAHAGSARVSSRCVRSRGRAGLPLVPVALAGTRSILRADPWFSARRGAVSVTVAAPIQARGRRLGGNHSPARRRARRKSCATAANPIPVARRWNEFRTHRVALYNPRPEWKDAVESEPRHAPRGEPDANQDT